MTTNTSITAPAQFTFRKSWLDAINRIRAKSTRSRLIQAVITYAFTHEFTLTGNATIDSLMTLIADQIADQLGRQNNFSEPIPTPHHPVEASESAPAPIEGIAPAPIDVDIDAPNGLIPAQLPNPFPSRPPKHQNSCRIPISKIHNITKKSGKIRKRHLRKHTLISRRKMKSCF